MAEVVDFESLMFQFLNSNNEIHQQAESYLNQLQSQPEALVKGLFEVFILFLIDIGASTISEP